MDNVRGALAKVGIRVPVYDAADAPEAKTFGWKKRPSLTVYRLLVSATALVFGTTKAYLSYAGKDAASKGIEWVYGSIISLL